MNLTEIYTRKPASQTQTTAANNLRPSSSTITKLCEGGMGPTRRLGASAPLEVWYKVSPRQAVSLFYRLTAIERTNERTIFPGTSIDDGWSLESLF